LPTLGLAACSAPTTLEKPGAAPSTTAADRAACREAAQREALSQYPYGTSGPYFGTAGGMIQAQQNDERDRAVAEAHQFTLCMRNKGYVQAEPAD
jgi:hypothetical protein